MIKREKSVKQRAAEVRLALQENELALSDIEVMRQQQALAYSKKKFELLVKIKDELIPTAMLWLKRRSKNK